MKRIRNGAREEIGRIGRIGPIGRIRARRILMACCLALLAGCATVTFKRGASPETMSADERACRAETSGEAEYVACLRERGVYVSGADTGRGSAETAEPRTTAEPAATGTTLEAAPGAAAAPAAPPAATAAPSAEQDAFARSNVASWWKLGATASDLDRSIDACVGKLGEAHRPSAGATTVTAGMQACLRADGWYAVGGSGAR